MLRRDTSIRSPRACLAGLLVFGAVALAAFSASAYVGVAFDFEGPVFHVPGEIVKDHSLVLIDGTFYLYFMSTDEHSFAYATSQDLRHWTVHPPILHTGPGAWDNLMIWAPAVAYYPYGPGYYLMYYTGVNDSVAQRTCLAMSHVPYLWDKASGTFFTPFHGDTLWIKWNEHQWSNYRDPGFLMDNGTCYLVQTATTRDSHGALALAASDDYFTWHDAGPLYVHYNWHALESPFLMKRNGVYHVFFTEEEVGGVSHMSSGSIGSGWDIVKRTIIDGGHAAEVLDLGGDRYLISRHTSYSSVDGPVSSIRIDTLAWDGDAPRVKMTNLLDGWTVLWGKAFDHQPVFGNNPRYRGDDTTLVGYEGSWWVGTYENFGGPLTGTEPGAIQGDAARGAIRSREFTVTWPSMRLLVGGGAYPDSCYVALCDAATGEVLYRETGKNRNLMDERYWDLYPYRGKTVYITIVDNCGARMGHINVDGIEERMTPLSPPTPPVGPLTHERTKTKKQIYPSGLSEKRLDVTSEAPRIVCGPNPFNPSARISIHGVPDASLTVSIYDAGGHGLCDLVARTDGHGDGMVKWDGVGRGGAPLPSGVYFAVLKDGTRVLARAKLVLAR
jgi:hypothetical protein